MPHSLARLVAGWGLTELQLRAALRWSRLPNMDDEAEISTFNAFTLKVWYLIQKLPFEHDQRELIREEIAPFIEQLYTLVAEPPTFDSNALPLIVVADGKLVTWTGLSGFYDLTTGNRVDDTPVEVLESRAYNLRALMNRQE